MLAAAADKGGAVHDAIEVHYKGRIVPHEYRSTVQAVVDLIDQHCGPQAWEAEKRFASPLGYGGKIDLISPEWVIDFKTKPGDAGGHTMYDDQLRQLVSYDVGCLDPAKWTPVTHGSVYHGVEPRRKANVIVSRDIPGSVKWFSWDGADEKNAMRQFRRLLEYWQDEHDYFPHMEARAA